MIPNVLSIAGLDPSGGAGMIADMKTISALGAYGCGIVTALTSQNTKIVNGISLVDVNFLSSQIDTLFDDVKIDSVKIGMLGSKKITSLVVNKLNLLKPNYIVLDPVMVSKGGTNLADNDTVEEVRSKLIPLVTCLTPNLPEAEILLNINDINNLKKMIKSVELLRKLMSDNNSDCKKWVMLKGGHLPGNISVDIIYDGDQIIELPVEKIITNNTHGTGCSLSAAIAALLPVYNDAYTVAKIAKEYLYNAIRYSNNLRVGSGNGPVNHFYQWW